MKERDPNPYWQHDILLDLSQAVPHPGIPVRLRVHESNESYFLSQREIIPLSSSQGTRRSFQGQPYTLAPEFLVTVDLFPHPGPGGQIGTVAESSVAGLRHQQLGTMQAWFYPADQALIVWEVDLHDRYRTEPPAEDGLLSTLWQNWEQFLLSRCPEAEFIATPSVEPDYHPDPWQEFLETQGYQQADERAFLKEVSPR